MRYGWGTISRRYLRERHVIPNMAWDALITFDAALAVKAGSCDLVSIHGRNYPARIKKAHFVLVF
jgi:hypothetical protein